MSLSALLVAGATATTNPNPNTLGTVNPYPAPYVNQYTVSSTWAAQSLTNSPALFPVFFTDGRGLIPRPQDITLEFIPSVANATYTVTLWRYNRTAGVWVQPKDNPSFTLTGNVFTSIANPGDDPWFIQLSSISSGNVAVYYDNYLARAQ